MNKYFMCILYLAFSVSGLTFIKLGANYSNQLRGLLIPIVNVEINKYSLIGYLCYICSFVLYTFVVTKFDLGIIIPILSGAVNVMIFIVAVTLLGETIKNTSIIGILLITAGVIFMNI